MAGGKKASAARTVREHIRTFLARCKPMSPEDITADVFADVDVILGNDNISTNKRNASLIWMGRFLEYLTGENPYLQIDPGYKVSWSDGRLGRFLFVEQMEQYKEYLRTKGFTSNTIGIKTSQAVTCCRVLNHDKDVVFVEQIDSACYDYLEGLMEAMTLRQRQTTIRNLDEFVIFCTGRTNLDRNRKGKKGVHEYERTPQWEDFQEKMEEFIEDADERGLRPQTLEGYRKALRESYRAILDMFGMMYVTDIDFHILRRLRKSMTGYRQRTIRQYIGVLGSMIEYFTGTNPYRIADINWPSEPTDRTWIFKEQWDVLWNDADVTERLILALAGGMGLRRSEITEMKLSCIDGDIMTICGKGSGPEGKVVKKPIPPTVQSCIREYMAFREDVVEETGHIDQGNLIIRTGSRNRGAPATTKYVESVLAGLCGRNRIHASCHTLRRFYCLALRDNGMSLDKIRMMMRHEDVNTTLGKYLLVDPRVLEEATKESEAAIFALS